MKKKTFYLMLAVWGVAVAVFAGVLINHFIGNNESKPSGAPSTEQGGDNYNPNNPDDEGWTSNY